MGEACSKIGPPQQIRKQSLHPPGQQSSSRGRLVPPSATSVEGSSPWSQHEPHAARASSPAMASDGNEATTSGMATSRTSMPGFRIADIVPSCFSGSGLLAPATIIIVGTPAWQVDGQLGTQQVPRLGPSHSPERQVTSADPGAGSGGRNVGAGICAVLRIRDTLPGRRGRFGQAP